MRTLVISPHLDDAAFSCGGLIASGRLGKVRVVTCLTKSVANPTGFALACQLDKGLPPNVDYMALRRAEDKRAMKILGARHEHYALTEAPHRGIDNARQLFQDVEDFSFADESLQSRLEQSLADFRPDFVLCPLTAGNHVDHQQVRRATQRALMGYGGGRPRLLLYYDQPYTNKFSDHYPELAQAADLPDLSHLAAGGDGKIFHYHVPASALATKLAACAAYATQIGFQFGDEAGMATVLGGEEFLVG